MNRFIDVASRLRKVETDYFDGTSGFTNEVQRLTGMSNADLILVLNNKTSFPLWDLDKAEVVYDLHLSERPCPPWKSEEKHEEEKVYKGVNYTFHVYSYKDKADYDVVPKKVREEAYSLIIDEVGPPHKVIQSKSMDIDPAINIVLTPDSMDGLRGDK
jgi:hypothetical protein